MTGVQTCALPIYITGLSVGNVGFLLNAAMRNLRGKLERDDKDEKIIYLTKIAS